MSSVIHRTATRSASTLLRGTSTGRSLSPRNTVFLCCDVQERFRELIHCMPSVLFVSRQLVSASNILQIPLLVTEQYPQALLQTCSELGVDREGHTHAHHRVFEKTRFSMLTDELKQHLRKLGRSQVVLFGVEAHVCVLQTALELVETSTTTTSAATTKDDDSGGGGGGGGVDRETYEVHIVADGTSSQREFDRSVAFDRLRSTAGVHMTSMEMVLFQLLQDAKHGSFKEISALCNTAKSGPRPDPGKY